MKILSFVLAAAIFTAVAQAETQKKEITVEQRAKVWKALADRLNAQTVLDQAKAAVEQTKATHEQVVKQLEEYCGTKLVIDKDGEPQCGGESVKTENGK